MMASAIALEMPKEKKKLLQARIPASTLEWIESLPKKDSAHYLRQAIALYRLLHSGINTLGNLIDPSVLGQSATEKVNIYVDPELHEWVSGLKIDEGPNRPGRQSQVSHHARQAIALYKGAYPYIWMYDLSVLDEDMVMEFLLENVSSKIESSQERLDFTVGFEKIIDDVTPMQRMVGENWAKGLKGPEICQSLGIDYDAFRANLTNIRRRIERFNKKRSQL
ncbi:MAG: hypothetical protein AAFY20_18485 [Cyanobacteria bacterium J06639_14]